MKPLEQPKKQAKVPGRDYSLPVSQPISRASHVPGAQKRAAVVPSLPAITKKPKLSAAYKDIPLSEASRYGTLHDYAFFDKVSEMNCIFIRITSVLNLVGLTVSNYAEAPECIRQFYSLFTPV